MCILVTAIEKTSVNRVLQGSDVLPGNVLCFLLYSFIKRKLQKYFIEDIAAT